MNYENDSTRRSYCGNNLGPTAFAGYQLDLGNDIDMDEEDFWTIGVRDFLYSADDHSTALICLV